MSKKKSLFYTVWQGRTPGVYDSWAACEAEVKGAQGARYKGFATRAEAEAALAEGWEAYYKTSHTSGTSEGAWGCPILPALAVDAACSGVPGPVEFRAVVADTGTEVFRRGPYPDGTNNIGEFLALVLGLAYLKKHNLPWVLYSDSKTAIAWLKKGHADTKHVCTAENQELFRMLRQAEEWLHTNTYTTQVLKWDTKHWGEIPADYGRK